MTNILKLFSKSFILISTTSCFFIFNTQYLDAQSGQTSFSLFGKREAIAEQNALLRQTQQQMELINSNPTAKLAYLKSMRQALSTKAEIAQINSLPPEQRASGIDQLYARLRAENQHLTMRNQEIFSGSPSFRSRSQIPGLPDFTSTPQYTGGRNIGNSQGKSVEATMMDMATYYKKQRRISTSPTLEVGPDDYRVSMRQRRTRTVSGNPEVSPSEVRSFMQQAR